jgi:hypothetical protein
MAPEIASHVVSSTRLAAARLGPTASFATFAHQAASKRSENPNANSFALREIKSLHF